MTSEPLVDVAIATYNHEKFIAQALESVLTQKTDFKYRLIIGDDCSTDNTQAIIKDIARKHPDNITTVFHPERLGTTHRDRIGVKVLKLCTAKYITMLDGDDYWTDPYKLQKQVDFLEHHPECSLCFHNAEMFYDDGSKPSINYSRTGQKEISTLEDVATGMVPIPCTVLFRNKLLGELPDCFYQVRNADWMLFVLLAEHGDIGYLNEVMAAYRVHGEGIWSSLTRRQRIKAHINTYQTIDAHLNFKYRQAISEKISELHDQLASQSGQFARSCLDQYHALVRTGQLTKAVPLLLEAIRCSPLEVLRPRRFAAVCRSGILGALQHHKSIKSP